LTGPPLAVEPVAGSIAPASRWPLAIARISTPHTALIRRLTDRNTGEPQYCRGTDSRAYCSVNGTVTTEASMTAARANVAAPRP
jgi:hypothetical protein